MATTLDVIVDRVRSVLQSAPFTYVEAQSPFDFQTQPTQAIEGCFRVVDRGSQRVTGGFAYAETRVDQVQVFVARKLGADPTAARRKLSRDCTSIVAAICREGEQVWGEFSVEADGRQHEIRTEQGAEFAVLQLTVPVNYEAQL